MFSRKCKFISRDEPWGGEGKSFHCFPTWLLASQIAYPHQSACFEHISWLAGKTTAVPQRVSCQLSGSRSRAGMAKHIENWTRKQTQLIQQSVSQSVSSSIRALALHWPGKQTRTRRSERGLFACLLAVGNWTTKPSACVMAIYAIKSFSQLIQPIISPSPAERKGLEATRHSVSC